MNKLTTKNAVKVSINKSTKQIRFTQQYFRNITEGEATLGTSKSFIILNKNRLDKMISEGWKVVDTKVTKVETVKEEWQPQYLVGGSIELEIQAYVSSKKSKQAVLFVKDVQGLKDRTKVSAVDVFGETKFEKVQPLAFHSAYDRFEKTQIGRERKAQMMEVGV